ncbi:MAG: antitoxin VapB family protein [Candidatus Thermoplasmatota archaeon]
MTRTVGLSDDAYDRLLAVKTESESFSDVVRRLTGAGALRALARTMPANTAEHYREAVQKGRQNANHQRRARVRRMLD